VLTDERGQLVGPADTRDDPARKRLDGFVADGADERNAVLAVCEQVLGDALGGLSCTDDQGALGRAPTPRHDHPSNPRIPSPLGPARCAYTLPAEPAREPAAHQGFRMCLLG
jgi:hypothetical protein